MVEMAKPRPIHEHVHDLVKAAELTHADIAAKTGWSEQRVYRLLSGKTELTAGHMVKLAELLGKPVASLYPREARAS